MNSTKADKQSQAQPKRNQNPTTEITDFLKKFKNGMLGDNTQKDQVGDLT